MSKLQHARDTVAQTTGVTPLSAADLRDLTERAKYQPIPVTPELLALIAALLLAVDDSDNGPARTIGPLRPAW